MVIVIICYNGKSQTKMDDLGVPCSNIQRPSKPKSQVQPGVVQRSPANRRRIFKLRILEVTVFICI
jgi:hypothetical protein